MSILKTEELKDLGDKHIAFMSELQTGGFPYDSTKTYNTGVMCTSLDSKGIMTQFKSLTDSNLSNDPATESLHTPVNWEMLNTTRTYDTSVTYTVGAGGDFTLLSDAISYASKMVRTEVLGSAFVEINLLSGYVWTEQIRLLSQNLGYVTITSVDATVGIDSTGWVKSYLGLPAAEDIAALSLFSSSSIILDINLDIGQVSTTDISGVFLLASSIIFRNGSGVQNGGVHNVYGITSEISAVFCNFSGTHTGASIEVWQSSLNLGNSTIINNGWAGVAAWGSAIDISICTFQNPVGDAIWVETSNGIIYNNTITNSNVGITVYQCSIDIRKGSITGGVIGIQIEAGSYRIEDFALTDCVDTAINVIGASLTIDNTEITKTVDVGSVDYGLKARGSSISINRTNITNFRECIYTEGCSLSVIGKSDVALSNIICKSLADNGDCGIWANGSNVYTFNVDFGTSEYGLYAEACVCNCEETQGINCTGWSFQAYAGSSIVVTSAMAENDFTPTGNKTYPIASEDGNYDPEGTIIWW